MRELFSPVPVPKGDFRTNEEEAHWLEQTICLRTQEMFLAVGLNVKLQPKGLYGLLLLSLNAASKRGMA